MKFQDVVDLLEREVDLYERLLETQVLRFEGLLQESPDSQEKTDPEAPLTHAIRDTEDRIRALLGKTSVSEWTRGLEGERRVEARTLLRRLQAATRELLRVNLRNYRYVYGSLSFAQGMLQELFRSFASYDGQGQLSPNTEGVRRTSFAC